MSRYHVVSFKREMVFRPWNDMQFLHACDDRGAAIAAARAAVASARRTCVIDTDDDDAIVFDSRLDHDAR